MKLKTYQIIQAVVVAFIAMSFSAAVVINNYFISALLLIVGTLVLFILRRQVKEVVADERDISTMGHAAALSIRIYSWIAIVIMLVLYAGRASNPVFEPIAMTLAFGTALLMVIYSFLFKYYNRFKWSEHKVPFILMMTIILLIAVVAMIRLYSGEDNWVCSNGQWIEHGHPDFAKPTVDCPQK
jgi:uncharacterized membrane protein